MQILTFQTTRTIDHAPAGVGVVYFVQCRPTDETIGPIRIGATRNLQAHLQQLVDLNPFPLYFMGSMMSAEPEKAKQMIQEQFATARTRGDWFRPTDELITFIRTKSQRPLTPPTPQVPTDRLLSVEDVARILGVSVPTIRRFVAAGQIPCVRIGRQLRFAPGDITALHGRSK